jgi:hypothetical protein
MPLPPATGSGGACPTGLLADRATGGAPFIKLDRDAIRQREDYSMHLNKLAGLAGALLVTATTAVAFADPVPITIYHSWFDPQRDGSAERAQVEHGQEQYRLDRNRHSA